MWLKLNFEIWFAGTKRKIEEEVEEAVMEEKEEEAQI